MEKEGLPAFSFWKKDRAHQENTKEVSLKEGERKRRKMQKLLSGKMGQEKG